MATWKKILREDYAVGNTLGLIRFDSATTGNTIKFRLWDNSNNGSLPGTEGTGLETLDLAFGAGNFSVSGTTVDLTPLQIANGGTNAFQLYNGTNYTLNFASDNSIVIDTTTAGTVNLTAATSTITGNADGNDEGSDPDTATFNLGDGITFTSSSLDILVSEASNVITIDLEVGTTTITGTLDSSTNNYTAGTNDITFASYTTTSSVGVVSSVSGTTVSLGVLKEDIQDVVGAMVAGNTETGITVTYVDGDNNIDFVLNNLALTGNTTASGAAITYNSSPALSITGAADSGITVAASNNAFVIDQSDITVTSNDDQDNSATLSPTTDIQFTSGDGSINAAVTGGGASPLVIDLEATPQVTDIDLSNGTSATYNITMTSATTTGDYAAFMDNGKLQWQVVDASGTESGTLIVNGNMTVTGTTTTLQTATVTVEDKNIILANPDSAYDTDDTAAGLANTAASGGGITLTSHHGTNEAHFAGITWSSSAQLTGWQARDTSDYSGETDVAQANFPLAVMEFASNDAPGVNDNSAGVGAFYMDTTTRILYLRTA